MVHQRVPLIIGVTGHRDLLESERAAIEAAVVEFTSYLTERYPNLPLLFLSGIAEGADTLVANIATRMGCQQINVLPMPAADYRKDFSPQGVTELDEILGRNETITLGVDSSTEVNSGSEYSERELSYERLGVFLAAHCHLLLAIWDGKSANGPGGTANVIRFHQRDLTPLAGVQEERPKLDFAEDESDLVFHIACSRKGSGPPETPLQPAQTAWVSRDDQHPRTEALPRRYDRVFRRMAEFNQDLERAEKPGVSERLLPESVPGRAQACCNEIQSTFGRCDVLATHYQSRTLTALRLMLIATLAAGLAFIVYADFENQGWSIWGYFLLVGLAIACFRIADRAGWQRKHVDYRVLAEALRVQYYWAVAGVAMNNPSRFSHDRFFNGRDLDLGWIRNVLRYTGLKSDSEQTASAADVELAVAHWVGTEQTGQYGYYRERASRKLKEHVQTNRLTNLCFLGGLLAASTLALAHHQLSDLAANLLVALMGVLPLLAAARQNYAHRVAQRELVAQYAQMHQVFAFASRFLAKTSDVKERQDLLQELGESALQENAQWVLRQRERPLPGSEEMV